MRTPLLGVITFHPTGGGVAVVSRLLWDVFVKRWGADARLLQMFDHNSRPATFVEKTRFAVAVAREQLLGQTDWLLFSHVGLAQAQQLVPRSRRQPYAVFLHGIEAWSTLAPRARQAMIDADLRIANSRYTARRIMASHPEIGHVEPCPLALPATSPASSRESAPVDLGRHGVLVVGRMSQSERYKGHDQLIQAWPAVLSDVPDAELVIVGEGDDRERLERLANQVNPRRSIRFLGFVPQAALEVLYQQSAVFALPSGGEGFGLVYLEAMTHRLPCVGSVHDAASEVIVDGETGRLVDQNNIAELAHAMTCLLKNDERRLAMGYAGWRRAQSEFSFERFCSRLNGLIDTAEFTRQARSL